MIKLLLFCLYLVTIIHAQQDDCFDLEISEAEFPFNHLSDLDPMVSDDTWPMEEIGGAGGSDYTYKLNLDEPNSIYVTTCDAETYVDVELAIYSSCNSSSWILYQDDATTAISYPDGSSQTYNFECQSGIVIGGELQTDWANMFPRIDLEAGSYYIAVGNRDDAEPETGGAYSIRTWIGRSLIVDSLTTSDDYSEINYHFSEGVYGGSYLDVYTDNLLPLDPGDYQININSFGGAATGASIQSLTKLDGSALISGDQNIKLNINYNADPSGVEEVNVGPLNESSIFNSVGIPLLDLAGINIQLIDALNPTINSTFPENNQEGVEQNINLSITFSEVVRASDDSNVTNTNAPSCFILKNMNTDDILPFTISTSDNITFIINPNDDFPEYTFISLEILSVLEDLSDNPFADNTILFRTEDLSPPLFDNESTMALTNEYVTIGFTEAVYSSSSGTGALEVSDLQISYPYQEIWDCLDVSLVGVKNSNGNPLVGGESVIRVLINPSSAPNGEEILSFSAIDDNSIFDLAGNALLTTGNSPEVSLNVSAKINNISLPDSNEYADIEFSVGVYGNSDLTIPLNMSSLNFDFFQNEDDGGNASSVVINNLKNIQNEPLSGGESIIRVFMSFDTLPSGVENIIIYPSSNNSIYSFSGVPMPNGESYAVVLKDQLPLKSTTNIEDGEINVNQNEPISIQFDGTPYVTEPGPPPQTVVADTSHLNEFFTLINPITDIEFSPSLYNTIFDPINNIYSVYLLEPFESEQTISYTFIGELQDQAGNSIELNYSSTFVIQDYLPPQINMNTLALDNTYWDLYFDDGLFSDFDAQNPITPEEFEISIIPNDSEVNSIEITSVTKIDGNFLNGGESILRLNLFYNSTPSGNEFIILNSSQNGQIFDESGNQIEPNSFIARDTLYDILPPSITSVSSGASIDSLLVLFQDRTLQYNFNEKIKSLTYSVTSNHVDSLKVISDTSDSSISLILQPPFASFDSITVKFDEIKDTSDLTTVDIAYTYFTPLLGDYNLDSSINFLDLFDLVENWKNKDPAYELGPFVGEAPHLIATRDGIFDIEDGMAFMKMWSWYQKTYGEITDVIEQIGEPPRILFEKDDLIIIINDNIMTGQFQFNYTVSNIPPITFQNKNMNENNLFLNSHSSDKGFSVIEFARNLDYIEPDTIKVSSNKKNDLIMFYNLADSKKITVQKGSIDLAPFKLPYKFKLDSAFPNPFNPSTTLRFDIPETKGSNFVLLEIYDIKGRSVETLVDGYILPGRHNMKWNAAQFSSGVYFVKLRYDNQSKTQKLILLK